MTPPTPQQTSPAFWTDDAELERYAAAKHERQTHPYHDLGELNKPFAAAQRQARFDLSFLNDRFTDVRSWRAEALEELRRAMALPVHPRPVSARVLQRVKHADHDREEIEFESPFGQRVPATVLIPHQGKPPFPAVVALHDMGGFRAFGREKMIAFEGEPPYLTDFRGRCYEGRSVGLELVARGFLVISIDAMMFGQRTPTAQKGGAEFFRQRQAWKKSDADDFANITSLHNEKLASYAASMVGLTWAGMVAGDDLATVDYLASRPDVDAHQIGCVGLSFGAYRANYLAALDDRIAAGVSVCWMATLDSIISEDYIQSIGAFMLIPGLTTRLDICDIASLACPRSFLAISGWRDTLMQPHGITSAHRKLRAVWQKAGAPDRLGSLCFDSPHEFNAAMQEQAYAWLQRHLGDERKRS